MTLYKYTFSVVVMFFVYAEPDYLWQNSG